MKVQDIALVSNRKPLPLVHTLPSPSAPGHAFFFKAQPRGQCMWEISPSSLVRDDPLPTGGSRCFVPLCQMIHTHFLYQTISSLSTSLECFLPSDLHTALPLLGGQAPTVTSKHTRMQIPGPAAGLIHQDVQVGLETFHL